MKETEPIPDITYRVYCENHGLLEQVRTPMAVFQVVSDHVIEYRECYGKTMVKADEGAILGFNLP